MSFNRADTMQDAIDWMRRLYSPEGVIHVGAGMGSGTLAVWREWTMVAHALMVDAVGSPHHEANRFSAVMGSRHIQRQALLSDNNGAACFHVVSNPSESGLLPAAALSELWPNLREIERKVLSAQRLDQLLAEAEFQALCDVRHQWLIIECLPALKILRGAGTLPDNLSVIVLRVLLQPLSMELQDCTLAEAEDCLIPLDFKLIHVAETNHPAVGEALFVRDWSTLRTREVQLTAAVAQAQSGEADFQAQIEQLFAERERLAEAAREHQDLIDVLTQENTLLTAARDDCAGREAEHRLQFEALFQERDRYAGEAELQQTQLEMLQVENAELHALRDSLDNEKKQLIVELEQRTKSIEEYQAQVDVLTQERDRHAGGAAERQNQIETLQAELADSAAKMKVLMQAREKLIQSQEIIIQQIDSITQQRDLLAAEKTVWAEEKSELTVARDRETLLASERLSQIERLEVKIQEMEYRDQLLNQEVIKAEAQIELIKDVLFRESAL